MQPNWQPIAALPVIAALLDEGLVHVEEQLATLNEARERPHVLDDATIARLVRFLDDESVFHALYDEQIARWTREPLRREQELELARLHGVLARTGTAVSATRLLVEELRKGTIEKVLRRVDELTNQVAVRNRA